MKKEIIVTITGTFVGGLMLHYYLNEDKTPVIVPAAIVKLVPAPLEKITQIIPQEKVFTSGPKTVPASVSESDSKLLPKPEPEVFFDNCKDILSATGLKSPHISARKINGAWEYLVPITFQHQYECGTSTCYDGSYTVNGTHINTTLKYGGAIGANKIKVESSYLGRKTEGAGECNNNKIIYNYVFTAGPPTGKKGIAKISSQ